MSRDWRASAPDCAGGLGSGSGGVGGGGGGDGGDDVVERGVGVRAHLVVGLLDISKPRGNVFLDRIEERLTGLGATVRRYKKPTFTKPAPVDLRHEIASQCEVVIEALAD